LLQAVAQHGRQVADRKRGAGRASLAAPVPGAGRVGLPAHGLDDVERESPGGGLEQAGVGERLPGDRLGQVCGPGGVQRAERQLRQQPGRPHAHGPGRQLRVLIEGVVTPGSNDEHRRAPGQPEQEGDKRQRLLVTPLHVVQDQEHRPANRQ
jgi:hypothetical protein